MNAITLQNVSFSYKEKKALKNVSLTIPKGQFVAILGPNGSGKSTLFKILSTAHFSQSGDVRWFDEKTSQKNLKQIRAQLGVTFQSASLDKKLTVKENLKLFAALMGQNNTDTENKITDRLKAFGLSEHLNAKVETLSGGTKRKVEIIKSMLTDPNVLLLDEPSAGLDPLARAQVMDMLLELKHQGLTLVMVTHMMDEAQNCDWIYFLNNGEVVKSGTPQTLIEPLKNQTVSMQVKKQFDIEKLKATFGTSVVQKGNWVEFQTEKKTFDPNAFMDNFGDHILELTLKQPSLEEAFGHYATKLQSATHV